VSYIVLRGPWCNIIILNVHAPSKDKNDDSKDSFYERGMGKLHNEELNDLYSLPNIVRVVKPRRLRWAGHVARMGEERGVHRVLVGKPEGKRPLGRNRPRWEGNINMDL
jgi:hypothetical protein